MKQEKLIIIGNGPAGCTAAVYAARAELSPLVFAGELPGGLLTQTSEVENFPGFPQGIQGFDLMLAMQDQAERFGARMEFENVTKVELSDGGLQKVHSGSGESYETPALIIATGAAPRYLGLPAENRLRGRGVSACATCDGAFFKDVPVAVLGGGDSAMEEAVFLTRFASRVHVIHRRDTLRASPIMAQRAQENPKIEFHWNSVVTDLLGEKELEFVLIRNVRSGEESRIACKGYFSALGHVPETALFRDAVAMDGQGYIILRDNTSHTNLAGVFACGDCADPRYRQAITAAGTGARAAIDAERYLESRRAE